jgi:hypothetical protein
MWTVFIHLSGSTLCVAAVIAVLGISARSVFRYPYMWRYLESRLWTQYDSASKNGEANAQRASIVDDHAGVHPSSHPDTRPVPDGQEQISKIKTQPCCLAHLPKAQ